MENRVRVAKDGNMQSRPILSAALGFFLHDPTIPLRYSGKIPGLLEKRAGCDQFMDGAPGRFFLRIIERLHDATLS